MTASDEGNWHSKFSIDNPIQLDVREQRVHREGRRDWHLQIRTNDGRGGVVALATQGDKTLLVESDRPAVGRVMWELPRGFVDNGDIEPGQGADSTMVRAGLRELAEETGLCGSRAELLGFVHPDTGLFEERVGVVHVTSIARGRAITDGEVLQQRWVPRFDLDRWISTGGITDGFTLSALMLLDTMKRTRERR